MIGVILKGSESAKENKKIEIKSWQILVFCF